MDIIATGDLVHIKSQSKKRYVYQVSEKSALLYWSDTQTCWWPLKELTKIPHDLFTYDVFPTLYEIHHPPVRPVDNDRVMKVVEDIWTLLLEFSQSHYFQGDKEAVEARLANKVHGRWRDRYYKYITDKEYDIVLDTIEPLVDHLVAKSPN